MEQDHCTHETRGLQDFFESTLGEGRGAQLLVRQLPQMAGHQQEYIVMNEIL